jgi:hypothetical protein
VQQVLAHHQEVVARKLQEVQQVVAAPPAAVH